MRQLARLLMAAIAGGGLVLLASSLHTQQRAEIDVTTAYVCGWISGVGEIEDVDHVPACEQIHLIARAHGFNL